MAVDKEFVIVVPKQTINGTTVVVRKCKKTVPDDDCNYCYPKYACEVFMKGR